MTDSQQLLPGRGAGNAWGRGGGVLTLPDITILPGNRQRGNIYFCHYDEIPVQGRGVSTLVTRVIIWQGVS